MEEPNPTFDRIAALARRFTGAATALVTVVDDEQQRFIGTSGFRVREAYRRSTPISLSVCRHVASSGAALSIADLRVHETLASHPSISELGVVAYLGVPLRGPSGQPIGAVCVIAPEPCRWSETQQALLEDLALVSEAELSAQHARRQSALLRANGGASSFTADASGAFVWTSPDWSTTVGLESADAAGWGWLQALHPEDRPRVEQEWRRHVAARESFVDQFRVVGSDGLVQRFRVRASVSDRRGEAVEYVGQWENVESHFIADQAAQRAEQAAQRAEAVVSALFSGAPLAMGVVEVMDEVLLPIRCNEAAAELAGREDGAIWRYGAGPGRADFPWPSVCRRVAETGRQETFDYEHTRSGTPLTLAVTVAPAGTGLSGRPCCAYYADDVTAERRQKRRLNRSEERLKLAMDSAGMGSWEWNLRTNTIDWSSRMRALCGVEQFGGGVSDALSAIYQPDRRAFLHDVSEAVTAARKTGEDGDLAWQFRVRSGGRMRWVRATGRIYTGADGTPHRMAGVATDVSDEVEAQLALREASQVAEAAAEQARVAQAKAEEMVRLKESILNNMSHEIRTPLTAVIGYSELLSSEEGAVDPVVVDAINRGAQRLLSTLNSVLHLARLEAGESVESRRVEVAAEAREAARLFEQQVQQKGLYLRVEAPEAPVWALADPAGLQRTLANLISNAIKFTYEGGVTVEVSEQDGHAVVVVRDTGCGMSEAFLSRAFEPFRQESEGVARLHEGTGIGLTIVKQLVELMGGSVRAESERGAGSAFHVALRSA